MEARRHQGPLELELTDGWKSPCQCWEHNQGLLAELVPLTPEPPKLLAFMPTGFPLAILFFCIVRGQTCALCPVAEYSASELHLTSLGFLRQGLTM